MREYSPSVSSWRRRRQLSSTQLNPALFYPQHVSPFLPGLVLLSICNTPDSYFLPPGRSFVISILSNFGLFSQDSFPLNSSGP
ncbi:hypothetical protein Pcinc_024195 [Petrolisthes cinctipes]|uniref:Uncharacterized protein n=1 Tax=Petrolisthes cinctipes TaxID=88211 RepID=A0AAE1FAW8_PETCI|nr:hypothetical protein Pcinc_024195 [Petrolisthes cinctipes]